MQNKIERHDKNVTEMTDKYFTKSFNIVKQFGDMQATYGVFMRRPVMMTKRWMDNFVRRLDVEESQIHYYGENGTIIPKKQPILTFTAPMSRALELETLILQGLTLSPVVAYNSYNMCKALPDAEFIDMHARHVCGLEMMDHVAYGVSVGSKRAQQEGAKGFIGGSTDATAYYYGSDEGMGTMPHAIIGYAQAHLLKQGKSESYARENACTHAMHMYVQANPDDKFVCVLVDYNGHEIMDALSCAREFYNARYDMMGKTLAVRLDTHGGRFAERLHERTSEEIVHNHLNDNNMIDITGILVKNFIKLYPEYGNHDFKDFFSKFYDILYGKGVSAANILQMRQELDKAGYKDVKIVASSGFNTLKCRVMGFVKIPIDYVGTGSFMPDTFKECYSTADIVRYDTIDSVKVGREWLKHEVNKLQGGE